MADKQDTALYKKEIKLSASIGDWTVYKPAKPSAKKIKPLFYAPHRLSKGGLEKALIIHNFFAFDFAAFLKTALKASIDIFNVSLEQITYLEFLKRVSGGIIYNKIHMKNIGEAMFLVDYQLANIVINFSLGFQSADTKVKELTELEESIILSIFGNVMEKYAKCWGGIFEKPTFEIISYPNIQRETYINLNEIITLVTVELSIANSVPATFTFVYQNSILKKMNDLLTAKEEKTPLNYSSLPESLLSSIEVPIIAELGTTSLFTQEIVSIENDDIIALDQKLNEPINLLLGYTSQLKAQPGTKEGHVCAKVLSSSVKKVKGSPVIKQAEMPEAASQTPQEAAAAPQAVPEEDFELPLEEEEKEEYNETSENIFEEENDSPKLGGN